jgi:hypothetical protein
MGLLRWGVAANAAQECFNGALPQTPLRGVYDRLRARPQRHRPQGLLVAMFGHASSETIGAAYALGNAGARQRGSGEVKARVGALMLSYFS